MTVRSVDKSDRDVWLQMRSLLWPNSTDQHEQDIDTFLAGHSASIDEVAIICSGGTTVGFIELRVRDYAEGSSQASIPFVEGWYVLSHYREKGLGRQLLVYAESWARGMGFCELASNTEIDNRVSEQAHTALGFREVERSISFLKKL